MEATKRVSRLLLWRSALQLLCSMLRLGPFFEVAGTRLAEGAWAVICGGERVGMRSLQL